MKPLSNPSARRAQAMAEFCVGMVAVLAAIGMIYQISLLAYNRTQSMQDAVAEAASNSMDDVAQIAITDGAEYLNDWETGPDLTYFSADDEAITGSANGLQANILVHADHARLGWAAPGNPLTSVATSGSFIPAVSLVRGKDTRTVPLAPVSRFFFESNDAIEMENKVFLTWLRGL